MRHSDSFSLKFRTGYPSFDIWISIVSDYAAAYAGSSPVGLYGHTKTERYGHSVPGAFFRNSAGFTVRILFAFTPFRLFTSPPPSEQIGPECISEDVILLMSLQGSVDIWAMVAATLFHRRIHTTVFRSIQMFASNIYLSMTN